MLMFEYAKSWDTSDQVNVMTGGGVELLCEAGKRHFYACKQFDFTVTFISLPLNNCQHPSIEFLGCRRWPCSSLPL